MPLVDLHDLSKTLYEALGPTRIKQAFVDGTHHNNYGSYELARCVVEGIRGSRLDLAKSLVVDLTSYDPSRPDPPESFAVPASQQKSATVPEGS